MCVWVCCEEPLYGSNIRGAKNFNYPTNPNGERKSIEALIDNEIVQMCNGRRKNASSTRKNVLPANYSQQFYNSTSPNFIEFSEMHKPTL